MAAIGSDGLSLLIGDGAVSETFNPLSGASLKKLEVTQRLHTSNAIRSDGWQAQTGVSDRKLTLEIEAFATDDAASARLRTLALTGASGNVQLALGAGKTLGVSVYATRYDEVIEPDAIKRMMCRLESSGGAVITG